MHARAPGLAALDARPVPPLRLSDRNAPGCDRRLPAPRPRRGAPPSATSAEAPPTPAAPSRPLPADPNQASREGSYEAPLVQLQAAKQDPEQPAIASVLPPPDDASAVADAAVVGCGPAGLALAAELAKRGVNVVLVGLDAPFVNNYGVWRDEFAEVGLEGTLDHVWDDAVCFFREATEVRVPRAYGRVCRRRLRAELLRRCADAGVRFVPGEVEGVAPAAPGAADPWAPTALEVKGRAEPVRARLVTLASGAAAGRLLRYEGAAPSVAAQTAYGVEAEVEGYDSSYDPSSMLFMDFRRHHSGLWPGTAGRQRPGQHPNGAAGLWGTEKEVPSFLYAMPLGGNRVFLEETCLVAKPALPFAVLKRRLERRCEALGLRIKQVHEEEWSYIPTGGALPEADQPLTAFGAAANLVHPATGYSIARSLREAPGMAAAITVALKDQPSAREASKFVWEALWTQEKRRQAAFHVFGMELLCQLDVNATADFFTTFFALPSSFWRGFLASKLSSVNLLGFAAATFVLAPLNIKARLVGHLLTDPAGQYLIKVYTGKNKEVEGAAAAGAAAALVGLAVAQQLWC